MFPDFTCTNTACCNTLTYEISSANTGTSPTTVSSSVAILGVGDATYYPGQRYLKQIDRSYLNDIVAPTDGNGYYWLYVSNKDATTNGIPFTSRSHAFTARITWYLVCGPKSTTVTEQPYPLTYTDWQFAQIDNWVTSQQTFYTLPTFSNVDYAAIPNAASVCPIESVACVTTGPYGFEAVSPVSPTPAITRTAIPTNITLQYDYNFTIQILAKGGFMEI